MGFTYKALAFVAVAYLYCFCNPANGAVTVLNFDDLPYGYILTGSNYASLNWETGIPASDGLNGVWGIGGDYTHSGLRSVINSGGTALIGISFPVDVDVAGAYFAKQGNTIPANAVRAHLFLNGSEIATTSWFSLATTPTWFDLSSPSHVDRILIESTPIAFNAGAYSFDDLTFTYVPEPASLALILLGETLMLRRRRRICGFTLG